MQQRSAPSREHLRSEPSSPPVLLTTPSAPRARTMYRAADTSDDAPTVDDPLATWLPLSWGIELG